MKFVGMIYTDDGDLVVTMNAKSKDMVSRVEYHIPENKVKFEEISIYVDDIVKITQLYKTICEMI